MVYYSQRQGKEADYTIDPIKFITYERVLFLAAYVYKYKEVRHFSLNKIKKLTPTGMVFPRRTYSLKELKRYAFGMIEEDLFELKVRFDKVIASDSQGLTSESEVRSFTTQ